MSEHPAVRIGIVTISDRASKKLYNDLSGPAIDLIKGQYLITKEKVVKAFWPMHKHFFHGGLQG